MVPDLSSYRSHQDKALLTHTAGVLSRAQTRCSVAVTSERLQNLIKTVCVFHDIGKTNPLFQAKLPNATQEQWSQYVSTYWRDLLPSPSEYSNHAYLSALLFLQFAENSGSLFWGWKPSIVERASITAIIAHHHGDLPDLRTILKEKESKKLIQFLSLKPPLPFEEFTTEWELKLPDEKETQDAAELLEIKGGLSQKKFPEANQRLDHFLETQFAFAALIEADKRDASDNEYLRRNDQMSWASQHFAPLLNAKLASLPSLESRRSLDEGRTQIRKEAISNMRAHFQNNPNCRTFSLTAPTGSGKTFALLQLASVIREQNPDHAVVYGLPFLTITEQVENICRETFCQNPDFISRFDSRAHNERLENLVAGLDATPDAANIQAEYQLLQEAFSNETFDAAFIVTTFVQIFETLLSNRNATLLKLPNFSKTIFLLDEIQALPPQLYIFFAAYLQRFCEKFDSFAIFSTATMPSFEFPPNSSDTAKNLFCEYSAPQELLDFKNYFKLEIFNRYQIKSIAPQPIKHELLMGKIEEQSASCLIILNTIADSRTLYDLLTRRTCGEVILLNTHFTLSDRQQKVTRCKELLEKGERVTLVSTQLIEAGVDIDFPLVFRDLCPLPNLIQSAGRCNRNGQLSTQDKLGTIWFFELTGKSGSRAALIYRDAPSWFLGFARERVLRMSEEHITESEMLEVQQEFFYKIGKDLILGQHRLNVDNRWKSDSETTLVRYVDALAFQVVGSFRLIDKDEFGEEFRYYVPESEYDEAFGQLESRVRESMQAKRDADGKLEYSQAKKFRIRIDEQLRRMAARVVQFRVPRGDNPPAVRPMELGNGEICGLRCLSHLGDYDSSIGIHLEVRDESSVLL